MSFNESAIAVFARKSQVRWLSNCMVNRFCSVSSVTSFWRCHLFLGEIRCAEICVVLTECEFRKWCNKVKLYNF
jgi:hypothetical protein